ncbi:DUF2254 domain-containing protein [Pseudoroseicyclus aestuarii]|uniref:Putative membrane protein n=1 Tax=Pseudoroseicyclus aestuarii TaxID=1795041 RepID=A0A318TCQ2_9RHOB|nr:DUF2254 domain-containing protein [Pseudoroseicyclus aestuarii]PYE86088.1 putative membrane protein [Pseudoroseicyclus aestuarii]
MFSTALRKLHRLSRRLWVRVAAISVMGVLGVALAKLLGPLIPEGMAEAIGADALNRLLDIISTSMLSVTTFSLSVMIAVYQWSSSQWTPRAHRMLLADTTMQTVLATFVGAWIYSLSAIIILSTPFYGEREIVMLYLTTLLVMVLIVVMILRWILKLQSLGSLIDTTARVEREATQAFEMRMKQPCLGGNALREVPEGLRPIRSGKTGYIQAIYQESLQEHCEEADLRLWVVAPVGRFVHREEIIAHASGGDEAFDEKVLASIHMGALRTVEQDPRFGLVMLAEIGSKALSPGMNDTGTALDVIGRIGRIIESWRDEIEVPGEVANDRLWIPPLDPLDLLIDGFAMIARDGQGQAEVQIALQKRLSALARHPDPGIAAAAREMAREAWARAQEGIGFSPDLERVRTSVPPAIQRSVSG